MDRNQLTIKRLKEQHFTAPSSEFEIQALAVCKFDFGGLVDCEGVRKLPSQGLDNWLAHQARMQWLEFYRSVVNPRSFVIVDLPH
jgi:hypothetical protein